MRRALITTGSTVAGVALLLSFKPHQSAAVKAAAPSTAGPSTGTAAAPSPSSSPSSSAKSGGSSGTYKGDVIDTRWGPVQVEITMSKGRLTAVKVLQVPSENPRDQEINQFAVPQLTQEALAAGSARIDSVSGATYTSEGYIQSLQSALDAAHA
ncbi:FMN-binding protein [Actinomadura montaniterrae]|uniref:FMN-binding protein n=1 Tax=Actinomadura montaniterrae TaxID=1803903 RepID=A0A6L3VP03_9ACTN|nr:FMN-binding protein [Actinomadura montaniterrae]KAB2370736.1 FMN-binding protein [Actinomadura montaniterrae]